MSASRTFDSRRFSASDVILTHADRLLSRRKQTGKDHCDEQPSTAAMGTLRTSYGIRKPIKDV